MSFRNTQVRNDRVKRRVIVAALFLFTLVLGVPRAHATQYALGAPELNYVILFEGNAGRTLSINNFGTPGDRVWEGNIGIGHDGQLAASGPGTLNGNIDFAAANSGQGSISNTTINGSVNFGVSAVTTALNDIGDLSSTLGAERVLATNIAIDTTNDQTVMASTGYNDTHGNLVFNVTSFNSGNGEDLIVKGDGSLNVVFDIGVATQFHGNILLQDLNGKLYGSAGYAGLTPDQVIFNMYDGANLTGGDTLDANNNGNDAHPANIMYGVFLNPNGQISFVNTRLEGRIYGGDSQNMQIVSGDTIRVPIDPGNVSSSAVPEPGSLLLLGSGLLFAARRFGKKQDA